MHKSVVLYILMLIAPLCSASEETAALDDDEIQTVIEGFSDGEWERALVSSFDEDSGTWVQQEPGERWWMEKLSATTMRSYADEGEPWEISLSPSSYVLKVLDQNGAATQENSYQITGASITGPRDWRLILENPKSEPPQAIEMVMFGDNYLFTLWTLDATGSRRDRWIALSHRSQSDGH